MIAPKPLVACPHCGSTRTEQITSASLKGMLAGGMLGAAFVLNRLIAKPFPVLASALITGSALGFLWGAQVGRAIGGTIDGALPRFSCLACQEEFDG